MWVPPPVGVALLPRLALLLTLFLLPQPDGRMTSTAGFCSAVVPIIMNIYLCSLLMFPALQLGLLILWPRCPVLPASHGARLANISYAPQCKELPRAKSLPRKQGC